MAEPEGTATVPNPIQRTVTPIPDHIALAVDRLATGGSVLTNLITYDKMTLPEGEWQFEFDMDEGTSTLFEVVEPTLSQGSQPREGRTLDPEDLIPQIACRDDVGDIYTAKLAGG